MSKLNDALNRIKILELEVEVLKLKQADTIIIPSYPSYPWYPTYPFIVNDFELDTYFYRTAGELPLKNSDGTGGTVSEPIQILYCTN